MVVNTSPDTHTNTHKDTSTDKHTQMHACTLTRAHTHAHAYFTLNIEVKLPFLWFASYRLQVKSVVTCGTCMINFVLCPFLHISPATNFGDFHSFAHFLDDEAACMSMLAPVKVQFRESSLPSLLSRLRSANHLLQLGAEKLPRSEIRTVW